MQSRWVAFVVLVACKSAPAPATTAPTPATAAPVSTTPPAPAAGNVLASDAKYRIEVEQPASCAQGCEAKLVLKALGPYHVNAEYPTKFVPAADVAIKTSFEIPEPTTGVMTLGLRPGTSRVEGTFKLALCTDDICEIEAPTIAFELPR